MYIFEALKFVFINKVLFIDNTRVLTYNTKSNFLLDKVKYTYICSIKFLLYLTQNLEEKTTRIQTSKGKEGLSVRNGKHFSVVCFRLFQ